MACRHIPHIPRALALGALLSLAHPQPLDSAEVDTPPETLIKPVALTFSGGVSLGAYQAGLAYTLTRYFRQHRALLDPLTGQPAATQAYATPYGGVAYSLVAVTGTSAGAGNATASAVTWCTSQEVADDFRTSVHHDIWVPMDIESFLPADPEAYAPDDGLLSTKALVPSTLASQRALYRQAMRPGCEIPLGLALTRSIPARLLVGDNLTVSTSQYLASYQLNANDDGSLSVKRHPLPKDQTLIAREMIPPARRGEIDKGSVVQAVLASGSIPTIFASRIIGHCVAEGEVPPGETYPDAPGCPRQAPYLRQDSFVDGGLFDRVPLALTVAYADEIRADWPKGSRSTLDFITIDPTRVRFETVQPEAPNATYQGLAALFAFTSDFVMVARQAQLHTLFQSRSLNTQQERLVELDRGFPVIGRYLGNFGAFMDPGFREYDFFTGVYEGIRYLSQAAWMRRVSLGDTLAYPLAPDVGPYDCMAPIEGLMNPEAPSPRAQACSLPYAAIIAEELNLSSDWEATGLIAQLFEWELARILDPEAAKALVSAQSAWPFGRNPGFEGSRFEMIVTSLRELDHARTSPRLSTDMAAYVELINRLKSKGYPFQIRDLERDPEAYLYRLARRGLARLEGIEKENQPNRAGDRTLGQRVAIGALRAASAAVPAPPAPRDSLERKRTGAEVLLPNYLEANVIQGGLNLGYEAPVLLFGNGAGLLAAEPLTWRRGSGIGWQISAEAGWYNPGLSRVSGIYAGPFFQGRYGDPTSVEMGFRLSTRLFANRLQIGVEVPTFGIVPGMPVKEDWLQGLQLSVGVVDIRGLRRLDKLPLPQNR